MADETALDSGLLEKAKRNRTQTPVAAPPPEPIGTASRPFRADAVWNTPVAADATRTRWIAPWSSTVAYAAGDCVSAASGRDTWAYVSVRGGTGRALPAGQASNADWTYCGVSASQWYDGGAGTPMYQGSSADPVWMLRFNPGCYANLTSGTWVRSITEAQLADRIWNDPATTTAFPTDYNTYVTVSKAGLIPPAAGSYDPKGPGLSDPLLAPGKELRAPTGMLPSQRGTDWTLIVRLADGTVLETFATVVLAGNRIVCGSYKITRPDLAGDGWQNGFRASMVPGYAGLITQAEWASAWQADVDSAGTAGTIPHALALLAPASLLVQGAVHPALAWDSQVNEAYTGTRFRMGERLALAPAFSLATSDFTAAEGRFARIIGRTLKAYGAIVVDRGGHGISILHESTTDTSSASQVLRHGGGALPNGTYYNDQMLRRLLVNSDLVQPAV